MINHQRVGIHGIPVITRPGTRPNPRPKTGRLGGAQEANDDVGGPREEGRQQPVEDAQVRHSGGVQPVVM